LLFLFFFFLFDQVRALLERVFELGLGNEQRIARKILLARQALCELLGALLGVLPIGLWFALDRDGGVVVLPLELADLQRVGERIEGLRGDHRRLVEAGVLGFRVLRRHVRDLDERERVGGRICLGRVDLFAAARELPVGVVARALHPVAAAV